MRNLATGKPATLAFSTREGRMQVEEKHVNTGWGIYFLPVSAPHPPLNICYYTEDRGKGKGDHSPCIWVTAFSKSNDIFLLFPLPSPNSPAYCIPHTEICVYKSLQTQ